jgi:hypothetical protein
MEPLLGERGNWLTQDFEWIALVVAGVLALVLFCSIAAAVMALLCGLAMLLRASFGTLMARWRSPVRLVLRPPEQPHTPDQVDVELLPLSVKEGKWAK